MTTQKSFKQRVRARAAKTGESYTTARAHLLSRAAPDGDPLDAGAAATVEELAGMSDDALHRGSGRHLAEWLEILDAWGARERTHPQIARWLVAEHGIGGWWSQTVTVAYERARGMRALHQQPDGFAVGATRTIGASAERVSDAFTDATLRVAWLPGAGMQERVSRRGRSARFDWNEPPSRVVVGLVRKGESKTQVSISHEKLPDADAAARLKAMWRERLTVLKELLESG